VPGRGRASTLYEQGLLGERAAIERFGRRLLADTLDHLHRPGAPRVYSGATIADLERIFDEPLPERGRDPRAVLRELRRKVMRHAMHMSHRRIFGLLSPAPLPVAALGDMAAALLNQSPDAWKAGPSAVHLEMRLIRWVNDLIGFGRSAFGVLTSGGGIANAIALKVARDRITGPRGRSLGLTPALAGRLRVYASDQAHFSIERALDLLGLGGRALVRVPSDAARRMRPDRLAEAITADRRRRLVPMAVVATAGTTDTGAIDPLAPLSRIARAAEIPLHVDAAYGGALLFSNRHRDRLRGLDRADSVTIDPHKWLFQPFSLGGLFVRDRRALEAGFRIEPGYLRKDLESEPGRVDFYHYSMEGSRPFRGLKLWLTLKTLGRRGLGALVDRTIEVAAHLEREVRRQECFEPLDAPVEMTCVCARYLPRWARRLPPEARDRPRARARLNRTQVALQQAIEKDGFAWFPTTAIDGEVYLKFGVFNYLTGPGDVDAVLRRIRRTAASLGLDA
jgi:aromatic-L-amino-acid decarboxylase